MGNLSGKLEQNFIKNQEFMMETQRVMLERQIHMQNEVREKMMALQIARARELLYWLSSFYFIAAFGATVGFHKTKKPGLLLPLVPLTFVVAYQADMAYGSKINRIKLEAENILGYEKDMVNLPLGIPSISSIDESRERQEESKRLNKRVWKYRQL